MLYYSHINEDSTAERALLRTRPHRRLIAVSGSGERVIALMDDEHLREIDIVDNNPEAIYLIQLKLTALRMLSVDDYLRFIGHLPANAHQREAWFSNICNELLPDACRYWQTTRADHSKGILFKGHFECFLNRIRPVVNNFLGKSFRDIFTKGYPALHPVTKFRWNILRKIFTQHIVFRLFGNRDAAFISKDAALYTIPDAIHNLMVSNQANSSFMMHLIFKGHLRDMPVEWLPPSLQPALLADVQKKIQENAFSIRYHIQDAAGFIQQLNITDAVFVSLSDILSFEDYQYLDKIFDALKGKEHTTVWRSFLRNRLSSAEAVRYVKKLQDVKMHSQMERTGMYEVYLLTQSFAYAS